MKLYIFFLVYDLYVVLSNNDIMGREIFLSLLLIGVGDGGVEKIGDELYGCLVLLEFRMNFEM